MTELYNTYTKLKCFKNGMLSICAEEGCEFPLPKELVTFCKKVIMMIRYCNIWTPVTHSTSKGLYLRCNACIHFGAPTGAHFDKMSKLLDHLPSHLMHKVEVTSFDKSAKLAKPNTRTPTDLKLVPKYAHSSLFAAIAEAHTKNVAQLNDINQEETLDTELSKLG